MHAMKSHASCADVVSVMKQDQLNPTHSTSEPKHDADRIAVSAEELMQLIHAGQGSDINELIRQTLLDRLAA